MEPLKKSLTKSQTLCQRINVILHIILNCSGSQKGFFVFLVTIHTFNVSYSSRGVLQCVYISGILIHHPVVYFPLGFLQHVDSWSLIGPCLDVLLALCQLQILLERMGVVHCSFTQECNTIGERALFKLVRCFFTSVFLVFSMRPYGLPKTVFAHYGWR